MNHYNEQQSYEIFIDLLADILLEHLSAESAGAEDRRRDGQNETEV